MVPEARKGVAGLLIWGIGAATGIAEPLDGATARALLFAPDATEVVAYAQDFLSDDHLALVARVAAGQPHYGAIAASPDEGINAPSIVAAVNYHDVAAARVAALRDCDARRETGRRPCVVVVEVRPRGWGVRDLQLSAAATREFPRQYLRVRAPKALAVSQASGHWAVRRGDEAAAAAVAACEAAAGSRDCAVVVAD